MSMNVKEALQRASFCLREAGFEQPRREAESLMTAALGVPLAWLYAHGEYIPETQAQERFFLWVNRRASGEPYAYLAEEKEFLGLMFRITPDVLIPRPETEFLVETVVKALSELKHPRILDVGTGSGAVSITLATQLPQAQITAVDISSAALAIAAYNAERHNVQNRVRLMEGDLFAPVAGLTFDAIVSNPPYIPSAVIETLQRDVKDFEPRQALDGGPDGLLFYRRLTAELHNFSSPPTLLAFEVGHDQAQSVATFCQAAGYKTTHQINDLAGIPRIILATTPSP
jgi:release factor glutamine methyltransferase